MTKRRRKSAAERKPHVFMVTVTADSLLAGLLPPTNCIARCGCRAYRVYKMDAGTEGYTYRDPTDGEVLAESHVFATFDDAKAWIERDYSGRQQRVE